MMIDHSAPALKLAAKAASLNKVDPLLHQGDRFTSLQSLAKSNQCFDIVIANPPAFAKSAKALPNALKAYRKLTTLCVCLVKPNSILFLASCSHPVHADEFQRETGKGLSLAKRTGRILRTAGAGADHPIHPFLHESAYLKIITLILD